MSQVATKKKLQIRNERVKVSAYFHEQGSVLKGDAEGYCDHFEIEVVVDSDAPEKEIQKLIDLARQMCLTEKALMETVKVEVAHTINGKTQPAKK